MTAFSRIFASMASGVFATATLFAVAGALRPDPAHAQAGAAESAVILAYQRFGESGNRANNVTLAQFKANIKEMTNGRYTVMSLPRILDAVGKGEKLPNRTLGITIDGAYRSVYEEAWPRLKAAGLPFTLFVATDYADRKLPAYMTWDEIRELHNAGVTIGVHTASFLRASRAAADAYRADLDRAAASFEAALGIRPTLFSYPNGEMSLAIGRTIAEAGIVAAFGYHSGAFNRLTDRMHIPRFTIVENYADERSFQQRVNTLALPVVDLVPADPLVSGSGAATFGFTVHPAVGRIRGINCFHSEFGQLDLKEVSERRFEANLGKPAPRGSWRINCTMPTGGKRFRWFGMQYHTAAN